MSLGCAMGVCWGSPEGAHVMPRDVSWGCDMWVSWGSPEGAHRGLLGVVPGVCHGGLLGVPTEVSWGCPYDTQGCPTGSPGVTQGCPPRVPGDVPRGCPGRRGCVGGGVCAGAGAAALTVRMRRAAASPRGALRVARTTRAPQRASSSAVAAPIPLLPPAEREQSA